jgi:hypothetical protein
MKISKARMTILPIAFLCLAVGTQAWATKRLTWNPSLSMVPVIAVDTKDNIYTVWYDEAPGNTEIYYKKSTNGGTTWTSKRLTWTTSSSFEPAIAIDSNDRVHIVFYDASTGPYQILYKKSTNGGTTWTSKRLTWTTSNSESPDIAIDSKDHIHLVWQENISGNSEIYHRKSTDGGATWSGAKQLTSNKGYSYYPAIAIDTNNNIHVAWRDDTSGFTEIHYMNSTDGGSTWVSKRLTWAKWFNYRPDIAIDSNDHIYVVWSDGLNIFGKKSTNGGTTWTTRKLTWTVGPSSYPTIAINRGNNHIHLVWQEAPQLSDNDIYHKISTDDGVSWTNTRLSWNAGESVYPAVAVDSSDKYHVVWEDNSPGNYEIFYANK